MQLGIIDEQCGKKCIAKDGLCFNESAFHHYMSVIKLVENQYAAMAFYKIGKMLEEQKIQLKCEDKELLEGFMKEDKTNRQLFQKCFEKALKLKHMVEEKGTVLDADYFSCLIEFEDMQKDPL